MAFESGAALAARVALRADADGVVVKVTARPGSGREGVQGVHGDALKLAVNEAPERGKANKALVLLLAETLSVPRSAVVLVSGETSREKHFRVSGVTVASLRAALALALGD